MTYSIGTKTLGQRDKHDTNAAQLLQCSASVPLSLKIMGLGPIYNALCTNCKGNN